MYFNLFQSISIYFHLFPSISIYFYVFLCISIYFNLFQSISTTFFPPKPINLPDVRLAFHSQLFKIDDYKLFYFFVVFIVLQNGVSAQGNKLQISHFSMNVGVLFNKYPKLNPKNFQQLEDLIPKDENRYKNEYMNVTHIFHSPTLQLLLGFELLNNIEKPKNHHYFQIGFSKYFYSSISYSHYTSESIRLDTFLANNNSWVLIDSHFYSNQSFYESQSLIGLSTSYLRMTKLSTRKYLGIGLEFTAFVSHNIEYGTPKNDVAYITITDENELDLPRTYIDISNVHTYQSYAGKTQLSWLICAPLSFHYLLSKKNETLKKSSLYLEVAPAFFNQRMNRINLPKTFTLRIQMGIKLHFNSLS